VAVVADEIAMMTTIVVAIAMILVVVQGGHDGADTAVGIAIPAAKKEKARWQLPPGLSYVLVEKAVELCEPGILAVHPGPAEVTAAEADPTSSRSALDAAGLLRGTSRSGSPDEEIRQLHVYS